MPTGQITDIQYLVGGMAQWVSIADGVPSLQVGSEIQLGVLWQNTGSGTAKGYIEAQITKPDGSTVDLVSVAGVSEVPPGIAVAVQMQPIALDQVGSYQGKFDLMMEEVVVPTVPDIRIAAYVFCPYQYGGSWTGRLDHEAADPSFWGEHQGGIITSAPVGMAVSLWVLIANYGDARGSRTIRYRINGGGYHHTVSLDPGYATWVQHFLSSTTPKIKTIYLDYQEPTEVITTFPFV